MAGILALLAHPDDEFFCAGLLSAAAAQGAAVHLAYWTRGEGSGSPTRRLVWGAVPRAWHYRAQEARRTGALLGAGTVTFLGGIDPPPVGGFRAPQGDPAHVMEKFGALCTRHAPELLVTHGSGGEYGHPAHQRLHEMAREYAAQAREFPLVSFAARWAGATAPYLNRDDAADYVLDSKPFYRQKMKIVLTHRSQQGVLESLADPENPSLRRLLRVSRFEGYRIQSEGRARAFEVLRRWAGKNLLEQDSEHAAEEAV